MTGRIDIFPEMDIPRMTALYWVRKGIELDDPILLPLIQVINESTSSAQSLQDEKQALDGLNGLLHNVFERAGFQLGWKHVDDSRIKSNILDAIETAMKVAPRERCLKEIGLSLSRYKRWRRERRECGITGIKSCPRGNANQLAIT